MAKSTIDVVEGYLRSDAGKDTTPAVASRLRRIPFAQLVTGELEVQSVEEIRRLIERNLAAAPS